MKAGNVGPRESRKRPVFGSIMLAVAVGAAVALGAAPGAPQFWGLLLFIPFWLVALGLLQASEKT